MLSEQRKEQIRAEAREILEKFGKVLPSELPLHKSSSGSGSREEGEGCAADEDFRTRMFANAANVKDDCIVAEKATW